MYLGQLQVAFGAQGEEVTRIQRMLSAVGYSPGPSDGVFGPQTTAAVKAFQSAKGLVPDGIVGSATWGALLQLTAPAPAFVPPSVVIKPVLVPPGLLGKIDPMWLLLGGVVAVILVTMPATKRRKR